MGVKLFQIALQNPMGVYQAGDWVDGQVLLELDEPTKARGVVIRFMGLADVHWTEQVSSGNNTRTQHYRSHQNYFRQEAYLWGTGKGGLFEDSDQHPAGHITYPFKFQLPPNLPSSFEGMHGNVRYWIECFVDRPWKFDYKCKRPFTVNAVYDLNMIPNAREAGHGENMKMLCCLCCASGPITVRLNIDRMGHVPGEYINITGEVDNMSRRKMARTKLEFRMATTFKTVNNARTAWRTLGQYMQGELAAGDTAQWRQSIPVPPLPPSGLIHCDIIDINYFVVLIASPSGPSFDLETPLGVLIGTVPLMNVQHMYSEAPYSCPSTFGGGMQHGAGGGGGVGASAPPAAPPNLYQPVTARVTEQAPPPSYADFVGGQVSIKDENDKYTYGNLNYAPQYPYFSYNSK